MTPDWSLMVLKLRTRFRYYQHIADAMGCSNQEQLKKIANGVVTDPKHSFGERLKAFYKQTFGEECPTMKEMP